MDTGKHPDERGLTMEEREEHLPGDIGPGETGLATDLYEISMAAAYFESGMADRWATFELFFRHLPENRSYLVACGQELVLQFLTHLSFGSSAIEFLQNHPMFQKVSKEFFDYLSLLRFRGDVWAIPEGTLVFENEPVLRVVAPIIEAQLIETYLLSTINAQTLIATKAARVVQAARGRMVVEFGARRAHGFGSALLAARAAYIAGCTGTSNVLAGKRFGIPTYGTMAHSFVMAFPREEEAFEAFTKVFPQNAILLIDTYDSLEGARKAVERQLPLQGVRLDSGDLVAMSKAVREILDAGGYPQARIFASGDLNEYIIDELLTQGAPIDAFGVGTEMVTSKDAPALGGVYKLMEEQIEGQWVPRIKLSPGKITYPGRKQIYRQIDAHGNYLGDILALEGEVCEGEPLLRQVIQQGQRIGDPEPLPSLRERVRDNLNRLPEKHRRLFNPEPYPVKISPQLNQLVKELSEHPVGEAT